MTDRYSQKISPITDFVFKRIFGNEGNEDICKDLVSSIIGQNIKNLTFKNPYMYRESSNDKEEILDIKAELDDGILCDIEVQIVYYTNLDKRLLDYWAKLYRTNSKRGRNYDNLRKTIIIMISDFELEKTNGCEEYQTKWKIMEEKLKIELTDLLEIDIIELPKVERAMERGTFKGFGNLKEWMNFLINPEEEISQMDELDEKIKKAYEEWDRLNQNEEEREEARTRYLELANIKATQEEMKRRGLSEGRKEGRKEKAIEIAKELLKNNIDIEVIASSTKLTKEEIKQLVNEK